MQIGVVVNVERLQTFQSACNHIELISGHQLSPHIFDITVTDLFWNRTQVVFADTQVSQFREMTDRTRQTTQLIALNYKLLEFAEKSFNIEATIG